MRHRALMILTIAAVACILSQGLQASEREIRISAEKLEADYANKRATFSGKVKVDGADFTLACDRLFIQYGVDGPVSFLKAEGNVAFSYRDVRATAGSAEMDLSKRTVLLKGTPVLLKEGGKLEGDEILIEMNENRFQVMNARGVFRLGKSTP